MTYEFHRILIVDDDLSLLPLWQVIFERVSKSARLEWAVSSEEAQRLIRDSPSSDQKFDLIIADLFLAGSDTGFEFLSSMDVKDLHAKTVLVSSAEEKVLEAECHRLLPTTKVIAKPLNIVKCAAALTELANS